MVSTTLSSSSTSIIRNEFELKSSITLSNMAVIMMDHGNFNEAFETSKAAVTTLQIATDAPNQEVGRVLIRGCLAQAFHYASGLDKQPFHPSSQAAADFLRIVWHDSPTTAKTTTTSTATNSPMLTAIRICEDDSSLLEETSLSILTSMILHNFAVSSILNNFICSRSINGCTKNFLCVQPGKTLADIITVLHLSRHMIEDAVTRHDLLTSSLELCLLSSNVSSSNEQRCVGGTRPTFGTQPHCNQTNVNATTLSFSRVFGITIVILTTLKSALQMNGNADESFACVARLVQVRELASVLNDQRVCQNQELLASAA